MVRDISSLKESFRTLKDSVGKTRQNLTKNQKDCLKKVEKIRENINRVLDSLQKQICLEIERAVDAEMKSVLEKEKSFDMALESLDIALNSLKQATERGEEQTFMTLRKIKPSVTSCEYVVRDAQAENEDVCITFEPNAVLTNLLTTCTQFGQVSVNKMTSGSAPKSASSSDVQTPTASTPPSVVQTSTASTPPSAVQRSTAPTPPSVIQTFTPSTPPSAVQTSTASTSPSAVQTSTASTPPSAVQPSTASISFSSLNVIPGNVKSMTLHEVGQSKVGEEGDTRRYRSSTGIAVLPSGDILVCDADYKVKLLNRTFNVQCSLTASPWDVTLISDSEAAVTLPYSRTVAVVAVRRRQLKLQPGRAVKTERKCWGLAFHNDNLYVSCHNNPGESEVIVLDRQGQLVRKVPGTDNFQCPDYIAVGLEGRLYVSDRDSQTVTCMTMPGQTVYRRSLDEMGVFYPAGLHVDTDNHVYIVGQWPHNLCILHPDGTDYRNLVGTGEGLSSPQCIAYRASDNTLMVGCLGGIQSYRFA